MMLGQRLRDTANGKYYHQQNQNDVYLNPVCFFTNLSPKITNHPQLLA
jgi:hypothetical protein